MTEQSPPLTWPPVVLGDARLFAIRCCGVSIMVGSARLEKDDSGSFFPKDTPNLQLDDTVTEDLKLAFFLHELGHAVACLCYSKAYEDESFADAFALYFMSLVRDNPELIAAIQEKKQ